MKFSKKLEGGSSIQLDLTPSFPSRSGTATLRIPDPMFPQIKGTLRIQTGQSNSTAFGQTAMGAKASFKILGNGQHQAGFKQLATLNHSTTFYAGLKQSDGSIEESSLELNNKTLLDCSPDSNLQSPWAPFYLPVAFVRNGSEVEVEMVDQPSQTKRLQRRNSVTDRVNFLLSTSTRTTFLTAFVVVLPSGKHIPIAAFVWKANEVAEISWTESQPAIVRTSVGVEFSEFVDIQPGSRQFQMLSDAGLGTNDTIVARFNRAMLAAQSGRNSTDYSIREFENYTGLISLEMKDRGFQRFSLN
jgi:hypothetical protein